MAHDNNGLSSHLWRVETEPEAASKGITSSGPCAHGKVVLERESLQLGLERV